MAETESPRLYLSRQELEALLNEMFDEKFSPEFYHLQQSMLEMRTRMGSLIAMLEARSEPHRKAIDRPNQKRVFCIPSG